MITLTVQRLALALMLGLLLVGCGSAPAPVKPPESEIEALQRLGLFAETGFDSADRVYRQGQQIHGWLSIRNDGQKTRKLELRPYKDQPGAPTKTVAFVFEGVTYTWGFDNNDVSTLSIVPGQTVQLVEASWDQKDKTGAPASIGSYDVLLAVTNLYVDGKHPWKCDTFWVKGSTNVQIQASQSQVGK